VQETMMFHKDTRTMIGQRKHRNW